MDSAYILYIIHTLNAGALLAMLLVQMDERVPVVHWLSQQRVLQHHEHAVLQRGLPLHEDVEL